MESVLLAFTFAIAMVLLTYLFLFLEIKEGKPHQLLTEKFLHFLSRHKDEQ